MPSLTSSATAVKPTRKPLPRHCRISAAVNGCFAVELTVGKSRTAYHVEPLPSDFGRAVRLVKFGATPGTDEGAASYEVNLDGPGSDCGCKGFLRHGRCKHVEGLLALVAVSKL
jgi:hypothetical protein